jgi:hypothetical protein
MQITLNKIRNSIIFMLFYLALWALHTDETVDIRGYNLYQRGLPLAHNPHSSELPGGIPRFTSGLAEDSGSILINRF